MNDTDSDGVIDSNAAEAEAAVEAAEKQSKILSMRLQAKAAWINPADKAELDTPKAAVDAAKGTAQGLDYALPESDFGKTNRASRSFR